MLTFPSPTRYNWPMFALPSEHRPTSVERTIKPELRAVAGREDYARVVQVPKRLVCGHSVWQDSSSDFETPVVEVLDLDGGGCCHAGLRNAPRDERTMHHISSQESNDKLTVNGSVNSHTSNAACVPGDRRHARRRHGKSILYSRYNSYKEQARSRDRTGPCLLIHCISRHHGHHLSKTYSNFGFIDE